jgi:threonine/homoserine/homoserine lactone efflux protein
VTVFPQFISPGDSPLRLLAMLGFYELVLLAWLNLYGFVLGGPGVRGFGRRMRRSLERVTGVVMIGLGVRLALEKR